MALKRGDYIYLTEEARLGYYQGYGGDFFQSDAEFTITVVGQWGYLNVRPSKGGRVYKALQSQFYVRDRPLGQTPPGMISVDDPGIAWFWEDAALIANRANFCREYDIIAEGLDVPGRLREFKFDIPVNGMKIAVKVNARSKKLAQYAVLEQFAQLHLEPASLKAIGS